MRTRRRPLTGLLLASGISQVGDQLALVAFPWFVLQTTGSPVLTGIAGAATLLPSFAGGLFGGILVDRLGYRRMSLLADLVSAMGMGLIPLLYARVGLAFWQLLALRLFAALLAVPGLTARRSLLPSVAERSGVAPERVTAAYESLQNGAMLLGPPVAGLLIVAIGAVGVLWLDALSFVLSAALIAWAVPPVPAAMPTGSLRREVLAGIGVIWQDRVLLLLGLNLAAANIVSNALFAVVLPVFAATTTGRPTDLGLLLAAYGAGTLVGAGLFGARGHRWPRRRTWLTGWLGLASGTWVLASQPGLPLAAAALALAGVANGPLNPLLVLVRLERIPAALRGRGFSTFSALAMLTAPLGPLVGGLLVAQVGLAYTLAALAVGYTVIALVLLVLPLLRELDTTRPRATGSPMTEGGSE